jgi:dephospho-CoA kinase
LHQVRPVPNSLTRGKSTVSTLLAKHGIPIIDADLLAREVIDPGTSGFRRVVQHFGPDRVLREDGTLDRAAIGDIVFHDPDQRAWLNGLVHPLVRRAIVDRVFRYWVTGHAVVVLDVPLLIEAGLWRFVGEIVVVFV